uniref:Uncharacterized protein n=1 Tax=Anguilla anguilla TaxID=7936 RepID=A0A0E9TCJ0_ANGAN
MERTIQDSETDGQGRPARSHL